jgi:hypothetical protein
VLGIRLPDLLYLRLPTAEWLSRLISKNFSEFEGTLSNGSDCGYPAFFRLNQS